MKIINKEEFLQLPEGTVFLEFKPYVFGDFKIKGETIGRDYLEVDLNNVFLDVDDTVTAIDEALITNSSFDVNFNVYNRNGMFDDEQMYAVYEQNEIEKLIAVLKEGVPYNKSNM